MINDAHIHFFSPGFFDALARQRDSAELSGSAIPASIGWDDPVSPDALADRWVAELDRHGVSRAAMMASLPGDADSVETAIARHPSRFVGFFMLDPTRDNALEYAARALDAGLRTACLFPAMHRYALHDPRVERVFELVPSHDPSTGSGSTRAASRVEAAKRPSPTNAVSPRSADGATPTSDRRPRVPGGAGAPTPTIPSTKLETGPCVFVHCGVLSVGVRKKLGLPSPFDIRFGNPLDLHAVALRFASVPIIVPHFGAGMFREALMLANLYPNVHLDTSSSNSWIKYTPNLTLEQVFQTALNVIRPNRLLFGSDSSFFPRKWNQEVYERQRTALDTISATPDVQDKIFGGNFARLFGTE